MEWVMRYIPFQTRERRCSRALWRSWRKRNIEKNEFGLYANVAELAPKVIGEERHIYKGVAANVDFYSGFVYSMLDLPLELYTPMFACARIVGWSAHRMEELINTDKIIRPAYKNVQEAVQYIPLSDR